MDVWGKEGNLEPRKGGGQTFLRYSDRGYFQFPLIRGYGSFLELPNIQLPNILQCIWIYTDPKQILTIICSAPIIYFDFMEWVI